MSALVRSTFVGTRRDAPQCHPWTSSDRREGLASSVCLRRSPRSSIRISQPPMSCRSQIDAVQARGLLVVAQEQALSDVQAVQVELARQGRALEFELTTDLGAAEVDLSLGARCRRARDPSP